MNPIRAIAAGICFPLAVGICFAWPHLTISADDHSNGSRRAFAAEVLRLSEPGGDFDTDNLISNERSYLDVLPALREAGVAGGAYVGVGPDQNFSYVAQIRPSVAFIVDLRRDNLLLHLLFKALFAIARTRVEYLSVLTDRPPPQDLGSWRDAPLERVVRYIDETPPAPQPALDRVRKRLDRYIDSFGLELSESDVAAIHRFHGAFSRAGLSLQFQSHGRPPRSSYPTYRDLLLGTDGTGRYRHFLASNEDFEFVRSLEARDLVIPVVGDLGGRHAVAAIGGAIAQRGERLSAFYVSNVEDYLFRRGVFDRYIENLQHLPRSDRSMIVRSIFGYGGSRSAVQSVNRLLAGWAAGTTRSYWDLVRP